MEARLAVVADETSPTRTAAAALRDLRHAIEAQHQAALVKPALAELEAERDRALASMAEDLARCGLDAQVRWLLCLAGGAPCAGLVGGQACLHAAIATRAIAATRQGICDVSSNPPLPPPHCPQAAIAASTGAASSSGSAAVRGMVQQLIEEARRLPPMPPMPVDYSGLLASVHRWIEELQGAATDVETAQAVRALPAVAVPERAVACAWFNSAC